jgi:hypothetical protein
LVRAAVGVVLTIAAIVYVVRLVVYAAASYPQALPDNRPHDDHTAAINAALHRFIDLHERQR